METFYQIKPNLLEQSAVALGFFDGVHPGHQAVIQLALDEAKQRSIPACVATFRDHPRAVIGGQSPLLLTTLEQRLELFKMLGVDAVLALPFTQEISQLAPQEYVDNVLIGCLGAKAVSVGYNHHFGRERQGNPDLLKKIGKEKGFTVGVAPEVFIDGIEVSSSRIRLALAEGNLQLARKMLNRPYAITGRVTRGDGRGRGLGFATANLQVSPLQLLPKTGVYAGFARIEEARTIPAVINVGYRPTVSNQTAVSIEAHLLDFDEDLYDQNMILEFLDYLRGEQKFDGLEALKSQISLDCGTARDLLQYANSLPGHPSKLRA